jgi:putative transposase
MAALYPQDKLANADRRRRSVTVPEATPRTSPAQPPEAAPLMRELMRQYALSGIPPTYLAGPPARSTEVDR